MKAMVDRVKAAVPATEIVREGKTWNVICETATDENTDIIVMASQGRTGLSHALIGSVAETVLRHSSCPVLIVRNQKE